MPNQVIGIDWSNEEDYSAVNVICSSCKTILLTAVSLDETLKGENMDHVEKTIICEVAQNEIRYTLLNCYGKTIPKKVIKTDSCSQACPICKNAVNKKYCGNCGQKLDYISKLN